MPLKLMYITNRPDIAQIAESSGVDRIFVDMEYIGKADRQGGMDSVQNHHTVEDVRTVRQVIQSAEVLVRVNPIHSASSDYCSSEQEIDDVIRAGADIIMLPFITDVSQVRDFLRMVDGRVKTMPLIETPQSVEQMDEILSLEGIDEIYIAGKQPVTPVRGIDPGDLHAVEASEPVLISKVNDDLIAVSSILFGSTTASARPALFCHAVFAMLSRCGISAGSARPLLRESRKYASLRKSAKAE